MKAYVIKHDNLYLWKHGNMFTSCKFDAREFGSYEEAQTFVRNNSDKFIAGTQFKIKRVA